MVSFSTFRRLTSPTLRILTIAAIPVNVAFHDPSNFHKYKYNLVVPTQHKFVGVNRLKKPISVRLYAGIWGKIVLLLEMGFMLYSWAFQSFGIFFSMVGLGLIFPPFINVDFIGTVFLHRKRSLARAASIRLGESSKNFKIVHQTKSDMVIQWPETNDVAYLSRSFGVWKIHVYMQGVEEVAKEDWHHTELQLRDRVLYEPLDAKQVYEATKESMEHSGEMIQAV